MDRYVASKVNDGTKEIKISTINFVVGFMLFLEL
jgi:hypothetical protein